MSRSARGRRKRDNGGERRAEISVDLRALAAHGTVHFVGVCGAGMSALAELLLQSGAHVTGCDTHLTEVAGRLRALGAELWTGHDPAHVEKVSAVVTTAAVSSDNPELAAARDLQIPVIKRAQALGALVNAGVVIGIAGTHGKTTTTAMTAAILEEAGLQPTAFVGGRVPAWEGGLHRGGDEYFVVEADEYDRSFLALRPTVAVVTTVEADHLDIYGSFEGVQEAFASFLDYVPKEGRVVLCADDAGARALARERAAEVVLYGIDDKRAQLRARDVEIRGRGSRFQVTDHGEALGPVRMGVPGVHNVRNALAAIAAAQYLEVPFASVQKALAGFNGVGRRFQELGRARNIVVVDDYAHHPTEIRATLAAARAAYSGHRLVAIFQPHLYSRTRDFAGDFGAALATADAVWVTDVYPAREAPIRGVSGELVARAAERAGARSVHYVPALDSLAEQLMPELRSGDICLFMGAGNIDDVARAVFTRLSTVHP